MKTKYAERHTQDPPKDPAKLRGAPQVNPMRGCAVIKARTSEIPTLEELDDRRKRAYETPLTQE